jgi:hypothetical protein
MAFKSGGLGFACGLEKNGASRRLGIRVRARILAENVVRGSQYGSSFKWITVFRRRCANEDSGVFLTALIFLWLLSLHQGKESNIRDKGGSASGGGS